MTRILIIIGLLLSLTVACKAQEKTYNSKSKKAIKLFEEGLSLYRLKYLDQALEKLNEASAADPNFDEPYIVRAYMLEDKRNYTEALENYTKALEVNSNPNPMLFYNTASLQAKLYLFDDALNNLESFFAADLRKKQRQDGEDLKALIFYRKEMMAKPVPFNPKNLGSGVNSPYFEHSPSLRADEQLLYFTRKGPSRWRDDRTARAIDEDLYTSKRNADGTWAEAVPLSNEINTKYNEGASCISPDGNYLFYTSCDRPDGYGSCDIYLARRRGNNWVNPRNLGGTINTRSWESQPSFSVDGRTLFYVSRNSARGDKEILMSRIQNNGSWSAPVSLPINTPGHDESPFMHPDGKTFYFASNGYKGMGGSDIFMCTIDEDFNFSEPVNLGYPINSDKDEVSLTVSANGKTAYYASGMDGGLGEWDLYSFELPEPVRPEVVNYSKGKVYDAETNKALQARFELIDLSTNKTVVESFSDETNGEFLVCVPTNRMYALNVSRKGYLFYSESFELKPDDEISIAFDVPLKPIREGQSIVLKNIFFETAKYDLKKESQAELRKLIEFLGENPDMSIEIGGHTDNVGNQNYNQQLSENRAKTVYSYLKENGIAEERLSFKGYNFSVPIASNNTEEGRAENRRTEFKIVKLNKE